MNDRCLLALEFSTEQASVALWENNRLLAQACDQAPSPSTRLWSLMNQLWQETGKNLAHVGAVAYGAGPGGFTGVRLACGLAQGLGLGLNVPLFPISTLESLLPLVNVERLVVALDARMNQVYLAAYERQQESWRPVLPPQLCDPHALPDLPGGGWWGAGSGTMAWEATMALRWSSQWAGTLANLVPHAAQIARLAAPQWQQGQGVSPALGQPVYLRQQVAQTRAQRGL